jgi:hypothetical protein
MKPASIVILTHALQGRAEGYFIEAVGRLWQAAGHRVAVHQGLGTPPRGDLAILHVDQTRVPAAYVALAGRYPRTLNLRATDIGKRRVSRNLVRPDDAWAGPVIVKTDANAFGNPDRRMLEAVNRQRGRWPQRLAWRLAERLRRPLPREHYPIYPDKAAVPRQVWRRRDLVVERFLPQRQGSDYVLNSAFVLGEHWIVSSYTAAEPLVKISGLRDVIPLFDEVPERVRRVSRELGLDYGKIDYTLHAGEAQVLDVNPTPFLGLVWDKSERLDRILHTLAAGLEDCLGGRVSTVGG